MGDENILERSRDDACTTLNILSATQLYTLKWLFLCYVNFTIKKIVTHVKSMAYYF